METQAGKPPHPLVWASAIALIVVCGAGVSAMMGWIPTSMGRTDGVVLTTTQNTQAPGHVAKAQVPAVVVVAAKCAECGVIQSVRELARSYEVTVRFDDGSSRIISEANPPSWHNGDKVRVINGVIQSNA